MRSTLVAILLLTSTTASADVAIGIPELIARPSQHLGNWIVIRRIRCVDPGGSRFVCAAKEGRRSLRIEASSLGPMTEIEIARKLIGPCKGVAKLETPACTFDVNITPTSTYHDDGSGGAGSVTVIISNAIEVYTPHRIRP